MAAEDAFPELPKGAFTKQDAGDDLAFYVRPRLVTHIDDRATAALTEFYRTMVPVGGRVLDLMSSWVSHLPDDGVYLRTFTGTHLASGNPVCVTGWEEWDVGPQGAIVRS